MNKNQGNRGRWPWAGGLEFMGWDLAPLCSGNAAGAVEDA